MSTSSRPTTARPTSPWPRSRCPRTTRCRRRCRPASPATSWPMAPHRDPRFTSKRLADPGLCREAAGRHTHEGESRMKIARIDSHSVKVPLHLRRQPRRRRPAHLDDQQHPAGAGRDRHRPGRLGRGLLLRLYRRGEGRAPQHDRARSRSARTRATSPASPTTCSRSCTCSAATASPSSPCRASTSRCGTSPARRPTCRCYRLLGGARRDGLPAYASLLKYRDPEKVAARTSAGGRRRLPPHQAARDRGSRGARGARRRPVTASRSWSTPTARGRPSRRAT